MTTSTQKLKGAMVAAGYNTLEEAAKAIGMKPPTMYRRIKDGNFRLNEVHDMIEAYGIENPDDIFFSQEVNKNFTN